MKNIMLKFVCVLAILMGMTGCSPNLDEEGYLRGLSGRYGVGGTTGVGFIKREFAGHVVEPIVEGTMLEMRGDGSLNIIFVLATETTPSVEQHIAQFVRLELEDQGLFRLVGPETYVAMGKEGLLLISTTNGENSEEAVFFEHLVPIATVKAE